MIRKIIVFLFFPFIYSFSLFFADLFRVKSVWLRYAITDNQLYLPEKKFHEFTEKNQIKRIWFDMDSQTFYKYFYDTYGAAHEYHKNTYDRMLYFKSAAHKTWFILKYL